MRNFAIIGVGGYVAPRHLAAIRDTGNRLVAAVDPTGSASVADRFCADVRFFTDLTRFDRHLEERQRGPAEDRVQFLSVCSPSYLHDVHCRLGLRAGADVICEKPLVINPWSLGPLAELEAETGRRVYTVLQLRLHPKLVELRARLRAAAPGRPHDVILSYVTPRGPWYDVSWKGTLDKSGGIATHIGVHLFDLLVWLFGAVTDVRLHLADVRRMSGFVATERARVRWFLSLDRSDLPGPPTPGPRTAFRAIAVDGTAIDFSDGLGDLHTRVYRAVLGGQGHGIEEARTSIELAHRLRTAPLSPVDDTAHPHLRGLA
jgi:UDP-N-acetyl-2-amino-2-deoxyglucuronate dehydrogenase